MNKILSGLMDPNLPKEELTPSFKFHIYDYLEQWLWTLASIWIMGLLTQRLFMANPRYSVLWSRRGGGRAPEKWDLIGSHVMLRLPAGTHTPGQYKEPTVIHRLLRRALLGTRIWQHRHSYDLCSWRIYGLRPELRFVVVKECRERESIRK